MSIDPALRRQFFAEEIQAISNLQTPALVKALACVPREAFLRPGPWLVVSERRRSRLRPGRRPPSEKA